MSFFSADVPGPFHSFSPRLFQDILKVEITYSARDYKRSSSPYCDMSRPVSRATTANNRLLLLQGDSWRAPEEGARGSSRSIVSNLHCATMPIEGKNDMDRIGLFQEMGYISIGDKYTTPGSKPFNEAASKNRQLLPGGSKSMANTLGGYFDSQCKRVFEGESYTDPLKQRRQYHMQQAKKNLGKAFLPSNGEKKPSGVGNYYGTVGGPITAFSAAVKARKAYTAPGKNFYTNPPKQGTGYGYPNLTLGKQYTYSSDDYDRAREMMKKESEGHKSRLKGGAFRLNLHPKDFFDGNPYRTDKPLPPLRKKEAKKEAVKPFKPSSPAKEPGGMKAGTFDPYPTHSNDLYAKRLTKSASAVKGGKNFQPPAGPKSYPIKSIMTSHVIKSVNPVTYKAVSLTSY